MTPPPPLPPRSLTASTSLTEQNSINIRDALSILSDRARVGVDVETSAFSNGAVAPPVELKRMGQTIDMIANPATKHDNNNNGISACGCSRLMFNNDGINSHNSIDKDELERHELLKRMRTQRGEEIRMQMRSMTVSELLRVIFHAQEERVATYRVFEEGLSDILASGGTTTYPNLCAKVTASFSVLSDTINAVKSTFEGAVEMEENKERNEILRFISQLQNSESDKLNLTAALHLERVRLNNLNLNKSAENATSIKLMTEAIRSLECKISSQIEFINEVLDGLRSIATG